MSMNSIPSKVYPHTESALKKSQSLGRREKSVVGVRRLSGLEATSKAVFFKVVYLI